MANRNMEKAIEMNKDNIPHPYDLTRDEIDDLMLPFQNTLLTTEEINQLFYTISNAFVYGFTLGSKATAAGKFSVKR